MAGASRSRPRRLALPDGVEPGGLPRPRATAARPRPGRSSSAGLRDGDARYAELRDDLAADASSKLSIPLHLGLLSPLEVALRSRQRRARAAARVARLLRAAPRGEPVERDATTCTRGSASGPTTPTALAAWKEGLTGYPVVDAGMRELAATGFMHNRARLIVASFLTKDLNIDWREGAGALPAACCSTATSPRTPATGSGSRAPASTRGPSRIFNPTAAGQALRPGRRLRPPLGARARGRRRRARCTSRGSSARCSTGGYPPPIVDHAEAAARYRAG